MPSQIAKVCTGCGEGGNVCLITETADTNPDKTYTFWGHNTAECRDAAIGLFGRDPEAGC